MRLWQAAPMMGRRRMLAPHRVCPSNNPNELSGFDVRLPGVAERLPPMFAAMTKGAK
jgi:hypothetical protein